MQEKKKILRTELSSRRRAVSASVAAETAERIIAQLPDVVHWQTIHKIHMYQAVESLGEVPTIPISKWIHSHYPHIDITYVDGKPNVQLPIGTYDVIFVPVLGFDRGGFRLGMGGGWYDRWLATQPAAFKIGLAYEWSMMNTLPREPHDIPLDRIIVG